MHFKGWLESKNDVLVKMCEIVSECLESSKMHHSQLEQELKKKKAKAKTSKKYLANILDEPSTKRVPRQTDIAQSKKLS